MPPLWPQDLLPEIRARVEKMGVRIVVLDDDPTGTETVHDVPVLTDWSLGALGRAFRDPSPAFFILTNSRSMSPEDAERLNREITANLKTASQSANQDFVIVSRTGTADAKGSTAWAADLSGALLLASQMCVLDGWSGCFAFSVYLIYNEAVKTHDAPTVD